MASTLRWHPLVVPLPAMPRPTRRRSRSSSIGSARAFQRSDFDGFAKRVASGEALRDAWQSANEGFEKFAYEARKAAERLDRQYSVSLRLSSAARSALARAREIDRDLEIGSKWRSFSIDFSRNWPRYRKQIADFLETPFGKSIATVFFLWFALSGWLFRFLIFGVWVLPFAGPLLVGTFANNLVIKGSCPACRKQFVGYKYQVIRCVSCGNTVWQPKGDFSGRDGRGNSSSKSDPQIIDVEFEEK